MSSDDVIPPAEEPRSKVSTRRRGKGALQQLPFAVVLAIVALGGLRIWMYHWRQGAVLIGGALLVGAVLRALLSDDQVGLLKIRGRAVDVLSYAAFGVVILFVAFTISDGPFG